jgi:ABC-type lipoprotein release transport system permease subunit
MPDNQKNKADENAKIFMKNPNKSVPAKTNKKGEINPDYVKYFADQINYQKDKSIYPYTLSYQNVITSDADEEYTYIHAKKITNGSNKSQEFHITGYKPYTKYLNIPTNLTNNLEKHASDSSVPILINKYIQAEYSLDVGDTIEMSILNDTNRFEAKGNNMLTHKESFTVQGILNTYNDKGIYTLQSIANKTIGMDKIPSVKEGLPNQYFNGIFTKQKSPVLLNTLPLYSPSGVYLPTDVVSGK